MRNVKEDDWKEYTFLQATNSILASVMDSKPCALHLLWISMLYKKYRSGDWKGLIPDEINLSDQEVLMGCNDDYYIFHKKL